METVQAMLAEPDSIRIKKNDKKHCNVVISVD